MIFRYESLVFPPTELKEERITKEDFTRKIEAEGSCSFLKVRVINSFEESVELSNLETILCGDKVIDVQKSSRSPSTSWKKVYDRVLNFLDVRAEDSRAFTQKETQSFEGVGYTIRVNALLKKINNLIEEETTKSISTQTIKWPRRKKNDSSLQQLLIPNRDYKQITPENGAVVLQTKRFCADVEEYVLDPFKQELIRWFEANTGYNRQNIPDRKTRHVERTIEIEPGSYIQIQLVREETPMYKEIVKNILGTLQKIQENIPVTKFKHTFKENTYFVNITSIKDYLNRPRLEEEGLIEVSSRYNIVP